MEEIPSTDFMANFTSYAQNAIKAEMFRQLIEENEAKSLDREIPREIRQSRTILTATITDVGNTPTEVQSDHAHVSRPMYVDQNVVENVPNAVHGPVNCFKIYFRILKNR